MPTVHYTEIDLDTLLERSEWSEVELGDIATFSQGLQVSTPNQSLVKKAGYVRFIRIVDFTNEGEPRRYVKKPQSEKYNVDVNDLVMVRYGSQSAGKIFKGEVGVIANNTFKIIPSSERIYSNWLFWRLKSPSVYLYLNRDQSSSTMPAITFSQMKSLALALPPLHIQKKIADILSAFDDKIELLREQNETLERLAQTIYKQWFVDYNFPDQDGKPYKDSGGKMIDSDLGMIPDGWSIGKIGDEGFCEIIGSGINLFEGKKVYLATADVTNANITSEDVSIEYEDRPSRANMQPIFGSVWFAKMENSRKLLMFDFDDNSATGKYILSTGFMGLKATVKSLYYVWSYVLSKDFDILKNSIADGAVQVAVNNAIMSSVKIVRPSDEALEYFNGKVKPMYSKIKANNVVIDGLEKTRDLLLKELIKN